MGCVMQVALLANLRQCSSSLVSFKANRVTVGHQMIPLNCILSSWIWPQDIMWPVITLIALPCVWWKCIGQTLPATCRLSHSIACQRRYMQIEGVEGLGGRWLCWKQSRHVPLLVPLAPFKSVCKLHKCTFKTLVSGVRTFFRQVTKEF